ncbi:MAG: hypothetical protein AAGC55_19815, partial [Myxococcota bacterium]
EQAVTIAERLDSDQVIAPLHLACGRTHHRREQHDDAIPLLISAAERAAKSGQQDVQIISLLLLSFSLAVAERIDESEKRFAEVIELCRRVGDDFHMAAALLNRELLWIKRNDLDRAIEDARGVVSLARLMGNAQLERWATGNMAEFYYWSGSFERAHKLASHARDLHLRFSAKYPGHGEHLLLARIACSRGDLDAKTYVQWLESHCDCDNLPPVDKTLLHTVKLSIKTLEHRQLDRAPWVELADQASEQALHDVHREISLLASELASHMELAAEAGFWTARARAAIGEARIWEPRLAAVERALR